ncbi:PREDICTED: uncharacterized protein LOC108782633 [Cyphomyrmex costatus]|uniref:Uncharacterized protein n=1 Tax=Cyphomyrmex costatus TaxID=456900 RepID=A0A195D222_9HYME|nr:PREDICTED: uncharacterized protein LOC108782633 [Cyphomyrmex costatus]KYN06922.1 hypothetical protein ALC62_02157 [Cyphomyrmex costatus]
MLNVSVYVLFSLLIVSVSSHGLINNNTSVEEKFIYKDVVTAMVKILYRCHPKKSELTLLLGGDYNEFLKRAFFIGIPVALIGETSPQLNALKNFALTRYSFKMYESYNFIHFLRKSHNFILVASSQPMLRSILQRTKDSPWANPDGFYIIIDKETETRGCINARSFLWTAWRYNLLSVMFPCIDPNDGIVYYTFNPYSNSTPTDWNEVSRMKGREGHPWIMLKRKFEKETNKMCKNLNFDKTVTLQGYTIRLNAVEMEPYIKIDSSLSDEKKFRGDNSEIIKILLYKLKASPAIEIYNGSIYELGDIGPNGTLEGLMASLKDGKIDIGMNTKTLLILWKVRYTYPHTRSGLCVIAQPRSKVSQYIRLIKFMSPEVIIGIAITCLLAYVLFTKSEGYIKASLQVIRLVICVGILHPPKISSTRIFVCMILILFLIINALFQSHLSALLTVPIYYRDIDTIESLKKSGYTIYGPRNFKSLLNDPVLESHYVDVTYDECKKFVENSTNAVCLGDCHHLYYRIKGQDLIRSRKLFELTKSYVTREDWPLYQRVNDIIRHMAQTGLIVKSRADSMADVNRERLRNNAKKDGFKVMLLKQLAFSFYFLIMGYTCATTVFILELIIGQSVSRSENN